MLPGVYGFQWDIGHIVFLGAFYTVVALILITVARSALLARRDLRSGREPAIRWAADFHDLPERSRRCRHELTGEVSQRECPRGFDCRVCSDHRKFPAAAAAAIPECEVLGLKIPLDRRYHRGHTWVHAEADGAVTVGLDPLAVKLMGPGAVPRLPAPGTRVTVNGPAWSMRCGDDTVRVLSPVSGTVMEAGHGDNWYLKIRPDDADTTHLLSGREVESWMQREVERLQLVLSGTLADGGTLTDDASLGEARAEMLLEP